jgi:aminodeoxyfutalosine synthase
MDVIEASHPLADLWVKVKTGERLTKEDGNRLMRSTDIIALGYMANYVKEGRHAKRVYYSLDEYEDTVNTLEMDPDFFSLTPGERVDRLLQARELQDQRAIYQAFHITRGPNGHDSTGYDDLRVIAVSRLLLDNIEHIQTSFTFADEKLVQAALLFGVDDLLKRTIEQKELLRLIEQAGLIPVARDAHYNFLDLGLQVL